MRRIRAAGSSLDRVVKVTVLLARPDLYREMNEAYAEFFPGPKPARAMVRFGADIPGVLVAIEAIALACGPRGSGRRQPSLIGHSLGYSSSDLDGPRRRGPPARAEWTGPPRR